MLYLNPKLLCYCVSRPRSYLNFFSIPILCPYFHGRGQEPLCVSIPMQMQRPAQPSDLAHSSKPSSTLSRLDIKTQTLASQPQRYEVWCSNQCTALSQLQNFFTFICSISRLQQLQQRWGALQICHSMKCYMIFGLCGRAARKIISQSIILFQTTNVFLGPGLRPPGLISSPALLSQFEICRLGYSFFDNSRLGYQCYQCDVTIFHLSKYEPSPHLLSCAQSKILIIFDINILSQSLCCRITLWWRGLWLKILIPSHKRPMSVIKTTIKLIFDKTIGHFNSWKMRPERAGGNWQIQHIHSLVILPYTISSHIMNENFLSTNFHLWFLSDSELLVSEARGPMTRPDTRLSPV